MRNILLAVPLLVLCATVVHAETNEAKVTKRAKADVAKLFPQTTLGGKTDKITSHKQEYSEIKVESEGGENLLAFMAKPVGLKDDQSCALMLTWHGNGGSAKGFVKSISVLSSDRDPIITCGIQYQKLLDNGKGKFNNPKAATDDAIYRAGVWLINKIRKDHNIDEARIFTSGFSWGTMWADGICAREWANNRENFRFRAAFLWGSPAYNAEENTPPIPYIMIHGSKETNVAGSVNVVANVRASCTRMWRWGRYVEYHEIPGMGHGVNHQCKHIVRDVIQLLGGPGPEVATTAPALTFEETESPEARDAAAMCEADRWGDALAAIEAWRADVALESKVKRGLKKLVREIEKVAKKELKRVEDAIEDAMDEELMPAEADVTRLRAIVRDFADEKWIKDRHRELIETLDNDFAPYQREKERKAQFMQAWELEQGGKASEAKALYEKLAARSDEDQGKSPWPVAAAHRLTWWIEG